MWAASLARFIQYAGATGLFGTALFFLTLLPPKGDTSASSLHWPKPLLIGSSLCLFLGALLSLAAQSATMNGIPILKLDVPSVAVVLTDTQWGHAIAIRIILSLIAVMVAIAIQPSHLLWWATCTLGTLILASFAWTGHGASTEGPGGLVHLLADIAHLIAAGVWLGALAAFLAMLTLPKPDDIEHERALYNALNNFSGVGSLLVAVLVVSGLINSYFLIGLDHIAAIFSSPYSLLLMAKLVVFVAMLGLAAKNRFHLTPALQVALENKQQLDIALRKLRRSIIVESVAGLTVLALIGVFGMMEPLTAT